MIEMRAKSDPTPALPCKQGREQSTSSPLQRGIERAQRARGGKTRQYCCNPRIDCNTLDRITAIVSSPWYMLRSP